MRPERALDEVVVRRAHRRHDDEEHGGAWKVAFADFCLALMCLFLVLWVLAAMDREDAERRAPDEAPAKPAAAPDAVASPGQGGGIPEAAAELERLSERIRAIGTEVGLEDNIVTVVTAQGLRVLVHDTDREGMFELGSAQPSARFAKLLRRIGPLFRRVGNQVLVVGHTDARTFSGAGVTAAATATTATTAPAATGAAPAASPGSAPSNWSLSSARALAARTHLLAGGMPAASLLQVVGMADAAPMDSADPLAAANRRVELIVLTEAHARMMAATFGALPQAQPLAEGAVSSPADTSVLRALRERLLGAP